MNGALKPGIRPKAEPAGPSLPERLVAGGYPEPLTRTPVRARQWHRQYLRSIIERDVQDVARVKDAHELARLLELLALRSAGLLNTCNLANSLGLHRATVDHYIAVLERLFLVRRLPAWHRNRAKRLVKTPKVHLLDSGLAATPRRPDCGRLAQPSGPHGASVGVLCSAATHGPSHVDRARFAFLALSRQGSGGGRCSPYTRPEDLGY